MTDEERESFRELALILAEHVDNLQRLATTWGGDMADILARSDQEIAMLVEAALSDADIYASLSLQAIRRLKRLKARIMESRRECYREILDRFESNIRNLVQNEDKWCHAWIMAMLMLFAEEGRVPSSETAVKLLSSSSMEGIRKYGIYNGDTVSGIVSRIQEQDVNRIYGALSSGLSEMRKWRIDSMLPADAERGGALKESPLGRIVASIRKSMDRTRLQLLVNVTGIVNGVSNDVVKLSSEKNEKALDGVMWITALDEKVCEDCASYEGEVFEPANAPSCPAHFNCRCHLVPVTRRAGEILA